MAVFNIFIKIQLIPFELLHSILNALFISSQGKKRKWKIKWKFDWHP